MKYSGKKISYLIATGLITLCLTSSNNSNTLNNNLFLQTESEENKPQAIIHVPNERCIEIRNRLNDEIIILDGEFSDYISGINIDYNHIKITLVNGSVVERDIKPPKINSFNKLFREQGQSIQISDLSLDSFEIKNSIIDKYMSENPKDALNNILNDDNRESFPQISLSNLSVNGEFKTISNNIIKSDDSNNWLNGIDLSNCRKIWISNGKIDDDFLSSINNNGFLDSLIFTNCEFMNNNFSIDSQTLRVLYFDPTNDSNINQVNLSKCPNLQICSIGTGTALTSIDGLKNNSRIRMLSFGRPSFHTKYKSFDKSFEEMTNSSAIPISQEELGEYGIGSPMNTFIEDISAIQNMQDLEVIDITALNCVSAETLFETVKKLPNLKAIVGLEVNNAIMYSDQLVTYCNQNNIRHPFTDRSKKIKEKIEETISEIIIPGMSDREKIEAITRYIVNNVTYNFDALNDDNNSPEMIRKTWGEKLDIIFEGTGVCDGYEAFTHALLQAAKVKSYREEGYAHTWELVYLNGKYYQLDTTKLDYFLDGKNDIELEEGMPYYLNDEDSDTYQDAYITIDKEQKGIYQSVLKEILSYLGVLYDIDEETCTKNKFSNEKSKIISLRLIDSLCNSWSINEFQSFIDGYHDKIETQSSRKVREDTDGRCLYG